jgi:tripartite-type tricarboxylate transporter receptor subunit TctC
VKKLNADVNKALVLPDVKERFAEMGAFSNVMSPEQFAQYLNVEIAKFAKAIKDSGAKVE